MASQAITDYLTKQLLVERNIVTFRSLSRQHGIHVNAAKNELAAFLASSASKSQKVAATYLLCGSPKPASDGMDVDMEEDGDDGGDYQQTRMVIVPESELFGAKMQFSRIETMHVYSLSPSPIRDASHLCEPTTVVRSIDNKKGLDFTRSLGKIIGKDVEKVKLSSEQLRHIASSSKVTAISSSSAKEKQPTKEAPKPAAKEKPKATGKLDFSKARVTKEPKAEPAKPKAEVKVKKEATPQLTSKAESSKKAFVAESSKSRGTKRKSTSALLSDSEEEVMPLAKPKAKVSTLGKGQPEEEEAEEEEEEEEGPRLARRKGKANMSKLLDAAESAMKRDLHDMMDVDDDVVVRASSRKLIVKEEEEESEPEPVQPAAEDEDAEMVEPEQLLPKKKRKSKKAIPIGRNGLRKKRVVKSRSFADNDGFFVTEDYSDYESVEEGDEDADPPQTTKSKAKPKAGDDVDVTAGAQPKANEEIKKPTKRVETKASAKTAPLKSRPSANAGKGGQKDIASFFGKPKPK